MLRSWALLAVLALPGAALAVGQAYKCQVNGVVTYQHDPCPAKGARERPTVAQLNAERQKKQPPAAAQPAASAPPQRPAPVASFRCDGRTRCPQMTSCAEAKYFLANCPNVQMDGDRDGIPCEKQWCN